MIRIALPILGMIALLLTAVGAANAQGDDCQRVLPGNASSPCRAYDYLDGVAAPVFAVPVLRDELDKPYCQPMLRYALSEPLDTSLLYRETGRSINIPQYLGVLFDWGDPDNPPATVYYGEPTRRRVLAQNARYAAVEQSEVHWLNWKLYLAPVVVSADSVALYLGPALYHDKAMPVMRPGHEGWHIKMGQPDHHPQGWATWRSNHVIGVLDNPGFEGQGNEYIVQSAEFPRVPPITADWHTRVNACFAEVLEVLKLDAATEQTRQAEVALELATAARAAEEVRQAELRKQQVQQILLKDNARALWQETQEIRLAGLEERTAIWLEAVERWQAEDLEFSNAMELRIAEVTRKQAVAQELNASIERQRQALAAQLDDLEAVDNALLDSVATEP